MQVHSFCVVCNTISLNACIWLMHCHHLKCAFVDPFYFWNTLHTAYSDRWRCTDVADCMHSLFKTMLLLVDASVTFKTVTRAHVATLCEMQRACECMRSLEMHWKQHALLCKWGESYEEYREYFVPLLARWLSPRQGCCCWSPHTSSADWLQRSVSSPARGISVSAVHLRLWKQLIMRDGEDF